MPDKTLNTVNEHCLNSVMKLTESTKVITSEDVFDSLGTKLIAKGAEVNPSMRDRLIRHKLRKPLEATLSIENGLSLASVHAEAKILLETLPALRVFVADEQAAVFKTLSHLSLQPAATLLLSAADKSRDGFFRHSVLVTLIAISLSIHQKMTQSDQLMLGMAGLLHDIGEVYIDPAYLASRRVLTPEEWKHVATHPHIGHISLTELTDYPKMVIDAVANHHERLDGSGYPKRSSGQQISRLEQTLAVAETLSGIVVRKGDVLARCCIALKCLPDEYSREIITIISNLRKNNIGDDFPYEGIAARTISDTKEIATRLARSIAEYKQVAQTPSLSKAASGLLNYIQDRINKLYQAMNATGIDENIRDENFLAATSEQNEMLMEIEIIGREIGWRMRDIARDLHIRLETVAPEATHIFAGLIEILDNPQQSALEY